MKIYKIVLITLSTFFFGTYALAETIVVKMTNKSNVYLTVRNSKPYNYYCINSKITPKPVKISTHEYNVYDYVLLPNDPTPVKFNLVNGYAAFSFEEGGSQNVTKETREAMIITMTAPDEAPTPFAIFLDGISDEEYLNIKNNKIPECASKQK